MTDSPAAGRFANLLAQRSEILLSPLAPEACAERLKASVDDYSTLFSSRTIFGTVYDGYAELRTKSFFHNDLQTVVEVNFGRHRLGAAIVCRSDMPRQSWIILAIWSFFLAIFLLGALAAGAWDQVSAAALMLGATALFVVALRQMARGDHDRIVRFLRETLEASPLTAA